MSSAPGSSAAPDVELLFGPMLLGVLINTLLYGVLLVQMLIYYQRYKGDRKWFRYLALYLLVAETVNVVFDIGLIYEPLIFRYGTTKALEVSPLLLRPDAAVTVAISTPIQLFVAWRVKTITQSYVFPIIIGVLSIISFGGGISVTTMVSLNPEYADFGKFHPFVITWLTSTAACDIILSVALILSLYTRKTGTSTTDRYLDRIIRLTVQTGSITAVTALVDLLVFLFSPGTTLQFIWDFPLSKLYTISLLSTLNARPWTEVVSTHHTMNVLFEQTPVAEGINLVASYTSRAPSQLHRRRLELSTHEGTEDLERGFDVQKDSSM
ncbi:hypothetical protein C8R44DRAFT_974543 [Mycena epipterygia]|nr:hypothetical protein C8R44DRAFT_974543 [Mycena epipterygia]